MENDNKLGDILSLESNEHLTIATEKKIIQNSESQKEKEKQTQKLNDTLYQNFNQPEVKPTKKRGLFAWIKRLYGLGDAQEEDLEFVHTSYSQANEEPSRFSNLIFLIVIAVFSSLIAWAAFSEIDELARGQGKVVPTDKIQTVQSLDGGIISEIYVKEGDVVKKGEPLMKIDTTRFKASLEESNQEYLSLLAIKARLEVQAKININRPLPRIKFDKKLLKDSSRYDLNEKVLLTNNFNELKSSVSVLEQQVNQKRQELKEIESTIRKLEDSLGYIKQQRTTIRKLVNKGVKSKYELLGIEKEYTQTKGDLETARLSIRRSKYAITEARNKITEKINNFKADASNQLQKTVADINKFEARLVGDKDKVAKTTIESPVNGIIKQLYFNTIGGVVKSGMDLIDIVPLSDGLVVEAKINPKDIAFISPTQKVIIKITAYDFSIYGGLDGKIIEISADSIIDKESKDGKSYYRVLVKTDKNYLERRGKKLPIIPGMVASVDIVTGKKTILDFVLKPILKVKQDSLHER